MFSRSRQTSPVAFSFFSEQERLRIQYIAARPSNQFTLTFMRMHCCVPCSTEENLGESGETGEDQGKPRRTRENHKEPRKTVEMQGTLWKTNENQRKLRQTGQAPTKKTIYFNQKHKISIHVCFKAHNFSTRQSKNIPVHFHRPTIDTEILKITRT